MILYITITDSRDLVEFSLLNPCSVNCLGEVRVVACRPPVYLGSCMKAVKFCCCRILGKYFDVVYCWLVIWTELGENKIIIVNCFPFLPPSPHYPLSLSLPPSPLRILFINRKANEKGERKRGVLW
jgi:hypothetical protein